LIRFIRRQRVAVAAIGVLVIGALSAAPAAAQGGDEVFISGSSTVEPITSLNAEIFAEDNPDASIRVDGPGTGDGFQLFCEDETDASDASREIKTEEADACSAAGIDYTELKVGIDGLTVVANTSSDIKCLSFNDLYAMFGPESGSGETDLAEASALAEELGGSRAPTSGTVEKFTPGPESGTYDSFIEITYEGTLEDRLAAGDIPADRTGTNDDGEPEVTEPLVAAGTFPNDNDIVKRVEDTNNGIGFFGFAYYQENKGDLKLVAIENPDTGKCVKPSSKTIRSGAYPIARPLFVYPNNAKLGSNATFKDFMDYYMTKKVLTDNVTEAGYVPLSSSEISDTIDTYKSISS